MTSLSEVQMSWGHCNRARIMLLGPFDSQSNSPLLIGWHPPSMPQALRTHLLLVAGHVICPFQQSPLRRNLRWLCRALDLGRVTLKAGRKPRGAAEI
jgi:hypothetical protein